MAEGKREYSQEEKRRIVQDFCKKDLEFLCTKLLGMTDWEPSLHGELASFLAKPGSEKLVLMPRGHLKTSLMMGWVIQQILKNPNVRILINHAIWDVARATLYAIGGYLTDKSALPGLFGTFKTPQVRWTRDEIEVAQRTSGLAREATITTGGVETSRIGLHFDVIINDDIVVRENVTTKEQIEKVENFHRDCYALLDPGGIILDIGTRWAMDDLYGRIITKDMRSLNGHVFVDEAERLDWRRYAPAA